MKRRRTQAFCGRALLFPVGPTASTLCRRRYSSIIEPQFALRSLQAIAEKLSLQEPEHWYNVKKKDLVAQGLPKNVQRDELLALLRLLYPQYNWDTTRFLGIANALPHLLEKLTEVERVKGITKPEDWYLIKMKELTTDLGFPKLSRKGLIKILSKKYPSVQWDPSRFFRGKWRKEETLAALERAADQLGIKQPEDWLTVGILDLRRVGFPYHITKLQLAELLEEKYGKEQKLEIYRFLRGRGLHQKRLEKALRSIFPNEAFIINARKEVGLINPNTQEYFEVDVWIPSLRLGFEFQERHHYISTQYKYSPVEEVTAQDKEKKKVAEEKGITLIPIPFWWDGKTSSLMATIHKARAEFFPQADVSRSIPEEMPLEYKTVNPSIEGIGEPTTACFFTFSNIDPTDWWLFEKYDGIRGFWNPEQKTLFSRNGNRLQVPQHILDTFPTNTFLDGEIWFGENSFQESQKIAFRKTDMINWDDFKYMVFDIPNDERPYEERYKQLERLFEGEVNCKYIKLAPKETCKDYSHFEAFFQDVIDKGGEGVILRDPSEVLKPGRSQGFLKHKKFRDAEAKVVKPVSSLQWECELPNGVRFIASAGTGEFLKRWVPKEGDIVSFKHRGFLWTSLKPKSPALYRIRNDLTWQDVCKNWEGTNKGKSANVKQTSAYPLRKKPRYKPVAYWREPENCRDFFDEFAKEKGFNPLNVQDWYQVDRKEVLKRKGGLAIHQQHQGLHNALERAYPELNFAKWRKIAVKQKRTL